MLVYGYRDRGIGRLSTLYSTPHTHIHPLSPTSVLQQFYEGVREAPGVEYVHAGEVDELIELRGEEGDGLPALGTAHLLLYLFS